MFTQIYLHSKNAIRMSLNCAYLSFIMSSYTAILFSTSVCMYWEELKSFSSNTSPRPPQERSRKRSKVRAFGDSTLLVATRWVCSYACFCSSIIPKPKPTLPYPLFIFRPMTPRSSSPARTTFTRGSIGLPDFLYLRSLDDGLLPDFFRFQSHP